MRSSLEPFLIASQSLLVPLHQTNRVAHSNRCQMATVRFPQLYSFCLESCPVPALEVTRGSCAQPQHVFKDSRDFHPTRMCSWPQYTI